MTNRMMILLCAVILGLSGLSPASIAQAEQSAPVPTIEVSATGQASLTPDMAILQLSVVRQEKTARAALDANNHAMSGVMKALRQQNIEEKDLRTSGFNIHPRYKNIKTGNRNEQRQQIFAYRVANSLTVRVRDLQKLGVLLDLVVTLGVNSGGNVQFTNDDPSDAISLARSRAMKSALAKAKTLVAAAGAGLGEIISIREGVSRQQPQPIARAVLHSAKQEAVPLAAGENSYSVSIVASWKITQ